MRVGIINEDRTTFMMFPDCAGDEALIASLLHVFAYGGRIRAKSPGMEPMDFTQEEGLEIETDLLQKQLDSFLEFVKVRRAG